jgi:hydroxyacylglutathione hydrolase
MTRESFVAMMTTDLPEIPPYFGRDVRLNREGPALLSVLPPLPALSPAELAERSKEGAVVLDTRSPAAFGAAHVPGSIHIALDGEFASWAGTVLPAGAGIVLVTDGPAGVEEARTRLARVGIENVDGYLAGGIAAWDASGRATANSDQITVDELAARLEEGSSRVVDVRRAPEWDGGHIAGAVALPLAELAASENRVPGGPVAVICAGGYRSSIAASLLLRSGRRDVVNVVGGMAAWTAAGLPVMS